MSMTDDYPDPGELEDIAYEQWLWRNGRALPEPDTTVPNFPDPWVNDD